MINRKKPRNALLLLVDRNDGFVGRFVPEVGLENFAGEVIVFLRRFAGRNVLPYVPFLRGTLLLTD